MNWGLTIAKIWATMSATSVTVTDFFTARDGILLAFGPDELTIASAAVSFAFTHLPLLQAAQGYVFSQQDVECGIYVLDQIVADEDDAIEAVKNHADLGGGVPAMMATLLFMSASEGVLVLGSCECVPFEVNGASKPCLPPPLIASSNAARFLQYGDWPCGRWLEDGGAK